VNDDKNDIDDDDEEDTNEVDRGDSFTSSSSSSYCTNVADVDRGNSLMFSSSSSYGTNFSKNDNEYPVWWVFWLSPSLVVSGSDVTVAAGVTRKKKKEKSHDKQPDLCDDNIVRRVRRVRHCDDEDDQRTDES
jgi:hypothetical protein